MRKENTTWLLAPCLIPWYALLYISSHEACITWRDIRKPLTITYENIKGKKKKKKLKGEISTLKKKKRTLYRRGYARSQVSIVVKVWIPSITGRHLTSLRPPTAPIKTSPSPTFPPPSPPLPHSHTSKTATPGLDPSPFETLRTA